MTPRLPKYPAGGPGREIWTQHLRQDWAQGAPESAGSVQASARVLYLGLVLGLDLALGEQQGVALATLQLAQGPVLLEKAQGLGSGVQGRRPRG